MKSLTLTNKQSAPQGTNVHQPLTYSQVFKPFVREVISLETIDRSLLCRDAKPIHNGAWYSSFS
ncbi:hypothetical protein VCRA2119O147_260015 [Vibrio crassostreae]|nr:hypothetical protein VCRA2119O147_260015 [Vibrio crassostreae]